jgi:hypothetical protein
MVYMWCHDKSENLLASFQKSWMLQVPILSVARKMIESDKIIAITNPVKRILLLSSTISVNLVEMAAAR